MNKKHKPGFLLIKNRWNWSNLKLIKIEASIFYDKFELISSQIFKLALAFIELLNWNFATDLLLEFKIWKFSLLKNW